MPKTYAQTFLYGQYPDYEKKLFDFLLNGKEVDKNSEEFEDIKYEVRRRQISPALIKVLESDKVVLITHSAPIAKAFKVFCAVDVKHGGKKTQTKKVYIDCTNIFKKSDSGKYQCSNIDMFCSYLVSAMVNYIYNIDDRRFSGDSTILKTGSNAFSLLVSHIVDYCCKISSIGNSRNKCIYICSLYYFSNILGLDVNNNTSLKATARKNSNLSEREAGIVEMQLLSGWDSNVKTLVQSISSCLNLSKLTLDLVIERWMYIFGPGTVFATEIFPAFSSLITDAYVGAYLNNQKTIEKVLGTNMVEFTKAVLRIGGDAV